MEESLKNSKRGPSGRIFKYRTALVTISAIAPSPSELKCNCQREHCAVRSYLRQRQQGASGGSRNNLSMISSSTRSQSQSGTNTAEVRFCKTDHIDISYLWLMYDFQFVSKISSAEQRGWSFDHKSTWTPREQSSRAGCCAPGSNCQRWWTDQSDPHLQASQGHFGVRFRLPRTIGPSWRCRQPPNVALWSSMAAKKCNFHWKRGKQGFVLQIEHV